MGVAPGLGQGDVQTLRNVGWDFFPAFASVGGGGSCDSLPPDLCVYRGGAEHGTAHHRRLGTVSRGAASPSLLAPSLHSSLRSAGTRSLRVPSLMMFPAAPGTSLRLHFPCGEGKITNPFPTLQAKLCLLPARVPDKEAGSRETLATVRGLGLVRGAPASQAEGLCGGVWGVRSGSVPPQAPGRRRRATKPLSENHSVGVSQPASPAFPSWPVGERLPGESPVSPDPCSHLLQTLT